MAYIQIISAASSGVYYLEFVDWKESESPPSQTFQWPLSSRTKLGIIPQGIICYEFGSCIAMYNWLRSHNEMWSWSKWCCKKANFTWIKKTKISVEAPRSGNGAAAPQILFPCISDSNCSAVPSMKKMYLAFQVLPCSSRVPGLDFSCASDWAPGQGGTKQGGWHLGLQLGGKAGGGAGVKGSCHDTPPACPSPASLSSPG